MNQFPTTTIRGKKVLICTEQLLAYIIREDRHEIEKSKSK